MRRSDIVHIIRSGFGEKIRTHRPELRASAMASLDDLPIMDDLKDAIRDLRFTFVQSGAERYGLPLEKGKRYAVVNGRTGKVEVEGLRYVESKRERREIEGITFNFQSATPFFPLTEPLIFVEVGRSLRGWQVEQYMGTHTFVPGDESNYRKALDDLRSHEQMGYSVSPFRRNSGITFITPFKSFIVNEAGNVVLFFMNGRTIEVSGSRENIVTLKEAPLKTLATVSDFFI